jgi:hypothetical protein
MAGMALERKFHAVPKTGVLPPCLGEISRDGWINWHNSNQRWNGKDQLAGA